MDHVYKLDWKDKESISKLFFIVARRHIPAFRIEYEFVAWNVFSRRFQHVAIVNHFKKKYKGNINRACKHLIDQYKWPKSTKTRYYEYIKDPRVNFMAKDLFKDPEHVEEIARQRYAKK